MKKEVHKDVKIYNEKIARYAKKNAVAKAA